MGRLKGSRIIDGVYFSPKEAKKLKKGARRAKRARVVRKPKPKRLKRTTKGLTKFARTHFTPPSYESRVDDLVKLIKDVLRGLL